MLHVALYQPEIPGNTGNIIRLCANAGFQLHLIHPLGFTLDDKRMRRAGLDYREWANMSEHRNYQAFFEVISNKRILACSTKGQVIYSDFCYQDEDVLLMGPETRGLPQTILYDLPAEQILCIPMRSHSRSLNLSNAASIVAYEAWRQLGFV